MDERRDSPRRRALKEAKVVLSDWTVVDCLLRDTSEVGARLQFAGLTELPATFRLLFVSSNQLRPVELEWQRGLSAGIRFTGPPVDAPARKSGSGAA